MNTRNFALTALSASILLLINPAYALQALQDKDLRQIDGQDGIHITTEYSQADIEKLYWEDKTGTAGNVEQTLRATVNGLKIRDTNANDGYNLGTTIKIDAGSNGATAGMDFKLSSNPSTISIDSFKICNTAGTPVCGSSLGSMAIQSASPLYIGLKTSEGLFSETSQAELNLGLNNINIYLGQKQTVAATTQNQLILKNFNFNFTGKGVVFVNDTEGLKLQTNIGNLATVKADSTQTPNATYGYVDLTRVDDPNKTFLSNGTYGGTNAGLNLEFMTKSNVDMSQSNPYGLEQAKGLIRVGASGRIVNGYLQVRGTDARDALNGGPLGFATTGSLTETSGTNATVMGSSGIAFRMKGDFTKENDSMLGSDGKATTLEIGGAGLNTFGFEFGNLSPLVSGSSERAYFDSGNVYLNLANTRHLQMPENTVLQTSRFGGTTNTFLTSTDDYKQQIHNLSENPYSLVMAIRGADFQAISKRGRFTSSSGVSAGNAIAENAGLDNQWGLGLPFYNLNANLAMYATTYNGTVFTLNNTTNTVSKSTVSGAERLGFALGLSVEGKSSDGSKTTSIMVIDGGDRDSGASGIQPTDYYIGLRNIDMLLNGYGSIGFENGNLNVALPNLLMVMAAEVAAGYLPGAKYKSTGATVPLNNFNLNKDVLFGLKIKLLGDMNFALVPNNEISATNGNRLSIIGEYKLTDGTVQLSDPIDNSMIGFDNMSGLISFNNAIVINKDNVGFNYSFDFNPAGQTPADRAANVFKVQDINFYPPVNSINNRGQRLGEMVITGGRMTAEMTLKPRN